MDDRSVISDVTNGVASGRPTHSPTGWGCGAPERPSGARPIQVTKSITNMKATKEWKYNALFNKLIGVNDLPNRLIEIAKDLEYPIFRKNDSYPINLNIWGIRSKSSCTKHYNDVIVMFYERDFNIWECMVFEATTDPSNLNLETPVNNKGCAVLREGVHKALWKIGKY